jgi:hypothetical protein
MIARAAGLNVLMAAAMLAVAPAARAQGREVPNLTGRVSTPAGEPLASVEVRIDDTRAVAVTDERGVYRFVGAPLGLHIVRFRHIGYLPEAISVNVPDLADAATVVLVPSRTAIDTVRVTARVYLVGGVVVDSRNRPIANATVDAIGAIKISATTDANGWFSFASTQSGPLLVKARKTGYMMATYSLDLDDARGIVFHLDELPSDLSKTQAIDESGFGTTESYVWTETQQRLVRRDPRSTIVPREQLAAFSGMSLGEAIRRLNVGNAVRTQLATSYDQACVLEDGNRPVGYVTLDTYAADDVDFVELYPSGTESSGSVQRHLRNAGCGATTRSVLGASTFYAVVWRRHY